MKRSQQCSWWINNSYKSVQVIKHFHLNYTSTTINRNKTRFSKAGTTKLTSALQTSFSSYLQWSKVDTVNAGEHMLATHYQLHTGHDPHLTAVATLRVSALDKATHHITRHQRPVSQVNLWNASRNLRINKYISTRKKICHTPLIYSHIAQLTNIYKNVSRHLPQWNDHFFQHQCYLLKKLGLMFEL